MDAIMCKNMCEDILNDLVWHLLIYAVWKRKQILFLLHDLFRDQIIIVFMLFKNIMFVPLIVNALPINFCTSYYPRCLGIW